MTVATLPPLPLFPKQPSPSPAPVTHAPSPAAPERVTLKQASERLAMPPDELRSVLSVFGVPVRDKQQAIPGKGPANVNVYFFEDVSSAVTLLRSFKAAP